MTKEELEQNVRLAMHIQKGKEWAHSLNAHDSYTALDLTDTWEAIFTDASFHIELDKIRIRFEVPQSLNSLVDRAAWQEELVVRERKYKEWLSDFEEKTGSFDEIDPKMRCIFLDICRWYYDTHLQAPNLSNRIYMGSFIAGLEDNTRRQFFKAILDTLKRRSITPLLYWWVLWFVLYKQDSGTPKRVDDQMLFFAFDLFPTEQMRLTTKDKQRVIDFYRVGQGLPQKKHLPREVKRYVDGVLKKSKNNLRRLRSVALDEATDTLSWEEERKIFNKNNLRQRKYRHKVRTKELLGGK